MNNKKKFTMKDVPGGYGLCTRNDCAVCNHCLRHIAYNDVVTDELWVINHVNPLRVKPTAECDYFRTDELATYAKGFVKMKQEMLPRQYDEFMCRLIGKFGRTGYYERRRGERLCTPSEIKAIRTVLQELKLPDLEFDGYVKQFNWCD
jgi:hypothetical protein